MPVNARDKGKRGENDFINDVLSLLGRERTFADKRNNQATAWGGANNADVSIRGFEDLHFEVKNTQTFSFPAWIKKLLEECGRKIPVLAYKQPRKGFWLLVRLDDIENFAVTWAQQLGYRVEK